MIIVNSQHCTTIYEQCCLPTCFVQVTCYNPILTFTRTHIIRYIHITYKKYNRNAWWYTRNVDCQANDHL